MLNVAVPAVIGAVASVVVPLMKLTQPVCGSSEALRMSGWAATTLGPTGFDKTVRLGLNQVNADAVLP
jgi:hypothetical protein